MLILSRKLGESIVIGEDVTITVLGVTGGQVRIGIDAPKSIDVHREEVFNRISNSDHPDRGRGSNRLRSRAKNQSNGAANYR